MGAGSILIRLHKGKSIHLLIAVKLFAESPMPIESPF